MFQYTSIREAAQDLRTGIITPTELIEETFEQIEHQDTEIQAFITLMREQAFKDAEIAEKEQRTGLYHLVVFHAGIDRYHRSADAGTHQIQVAFYLRVISGDMAASAE